MKSKKIVRIQREYSEAVKRQVVEELERGVVTVSEAQRRYGIRHRATISSWRRKYGNYEVITKMVRVVMKSEKDRIRELEEALADEKIRNRLLQAELEIYQEKLKGEDKVKKKARYEALERVRDDARSEGISLERLCKVYGVTRQAYYQHFKREARAEERAKKVVALVQGKRKKLPRAGGRKVLWLVRPELVAEGYKLGRDRFFNILRGNGLLLERRRKPPRTTYSRHPYAVAPNVLRDTPVTGPGQALVGDITYIRTAKGFSYLFLLTDVYSRLIAGYAVSDSLSHKGALCALSMAAGRLGSLSNVIHHTDRGAQYCCHEFLAALREHGAIASMTDADHCAQNALAERMNGILKDEFFLDMRFRSLTAVRRAVKEAVELYNSLRPHLSLGMKTPEQVFNQAA
jgi:transposase InsO family protein